MSTTEAALLQMARRRDSTEWARWLVPRLSERRLDLTSQVIAPCGPDFSGRRPALEVFLRMADDDGAWICAGAFTPSAIQHGLAPRVDEALLDRVLELFAASPQRFEPYQAVALNVCGASLFDPGFCDRVVCRLRAQTPIAARLCFDIDAQFAATQLPLVRTFVEAVAATGTQVALDGCRRAELPAGVDDLPLRWIKIHESRVRHLRADAADRAQIRSLAQLSRSLGRNTVALGVDDPLVRSALVAAGIDFAQGAAIGEQGPALN